MCNWHSYEQVNFIREFPYIVTGYDQRFSGFSESFHSYFTVLLVNLFNCNVHQYVVSDYFTCLS